MLEGKNVNLRTIEKEDLPLIANWCNSPSLLGECVWLPQQTRTEWEKKYEGFTEDTKWFLIERKDGTKIGFVAHFPAAEKLGIEIGYVMVPDERGKGYCTEAAKIMVDYLFLSRDVTRIQAHTDVRNVNSQKILAKAGFVKEGTLRKSTFVRGEWRDNYVYSILREEWKEPKTLTKVA